MRTILCFGASNYAEPSAYDREHMDENGHKLLADAVFNVMYNDILFKIYSNHI